MFVNVAPGIQVASEFGPDISMGNAPQRIHTYTTPDEKTRCRAAYKAILIAAIRLIGAKTTAHHQHAMRTFNQLVQARLGQNPTPEQWVQGAAKLLNEMQNEVTYKNKR